MYTHAEALDGPLIAMCIIFNREETFRQEFSTLGNVSSLLPPSVHVMALTATATCSSRKAICQTLGMNKPVLYLNLRTSQTSSIV